jgi:RNA polymerase sigma-70 factor (ECF subfamily)
VPADRPDAPTLDHAAAVFADVRVRVTRFITGFAQSFWTDTTITWVEANRQECFLVSRGDTPVALVNVEATADGIEQVMWMTNPEKLARISAPLQPRFSA